MPSAIDPTRCALPQELVACALTARRILPDEAITSAVSGRVAARDRALVSSTGRVGLSDEAVTCAETGAQLLTDEVFRCQGSGLVADVRLARHSDVSGGRFLARLLNASAVSGRVGGAGELVNCQLTGDSVAIDEVETCAATGLRGRRDRLVKSAATGRWFLPSECVHSAASGRPCGREEATICEWSRQLFLPEEVGICDLTDLRIARRHLSRRGSLTAIDDCMSDLVAYPLDQDLLEWSGTAAVPALNGAVDVIVHPSPAHAVCLAIFDVRTLLGLKKRWVAMVLDRGGEEPQILGHLVVLARGGETYTVVDRG